MYTFIIVLIIITCVLLALAVLVQNSKGGGLASGLASSNQVMGVRKTTDFLEKFTWGLAMALIFLSIVANFAIPRGEAKSTSDMKDQIENAALPVAPAPAPGNNTPPPASNPPAPQK